MQSILTVVTVVIMAVIAGERERDKKSRDEGVLETFHSLKRVAFNRLAARTRLPTNTRTAINGTAD